MEFNNIYFKYYMYNRITSLITDQFGSSAQNYIRVFHLSFQILKFTELIKVYLNAYKRLQISTLKSGNKSRKKVNKEVFLGTVACLKIIIQKRDLLVANT